MMPTTSHRRPEGQPGAPTGPGARVLLVSHYYPPHVGGIERAVQTQAEHLASDGRDVTVLTTSPGGRPGTDITGPGLRVERVPTFNAIEDATRIPFPVIGLRAAVRFRRLIKSTDLVHVHDLFYMTTWLAAMLAVITRKPLVLTQHIHIIDHPSRLVMSAQRAVYALIGRRIVPRCSSIFFLNATVREFLLDLGATDDQLVFVPNIVDVDLFRPATDDTERAELRSRHGLPPDGVLALFVGRFVPKKGFDKVAAAVPGSGCTAIMVGGEPGEVALHSRNDVIWLGSKDASVVAELYRACDVFVLPSVSEGFPLTVQEAMASGLAVITTDDPGYRLYDLDRTQLLLIRPDVAAIHAALQQVADDEVLRARMSRYSRGYAITRFTSRRYVASMADAYAKGGLDVAN